MSDVPEVPERPEASEDPAGAAFPDYALADEVAATSPEQIKALAHADRSHILDLVLERAATVTELATALDRPKSSVAYHVDQLVEAELLQVVRTRKVRAIEERFYGRTGRTIVVGELAKHSRAGGFLDQAVNEAGPGGQQLSTLRHARIPQSRAAEFFDEVNELAKRFTTLPRDGDVVFGFIAAVYPTDNPTLPESSDD
ncbi:MAG: winged helix-turn-helix domain-containing protein [Actinomycetota bacterium]